MAKAVAKTGEVKKKPLTQKQRKLVKGIVAGKTQKAAAKAAGLNEQYASDILKKPEVKATLIELMDNMGLSDECLLKKHKELLSACRESNDSIVPDYPIQAKALDMGYRLRGAFVDKVEISGSEDMIAAIMRGRQRAGK